MAATGLSRGETAYDFADPGTGAQRAVFDLAWPHGIQEELTEPVAVLIDEGSDVLAVASGAGFRCFVTIDGFKRHVEIEILRSEAA